MPMPRRSVAGLDPCGEGSGCHNPSGDQASSKHATHAHCGRRALRGAGAEERGRKARRNGWQSETRLESDGLPVGTEPRNPGGRPKEAAEKESSRPISNEKAPLPPPSSALRVARGSAGWNRAALVHPTHLWAKSSVRRRYTVCRIRRCIGNGRASSNAVRDTATMSSRTFFAIPARARREREPGKN